MSKKNAYYVHPENNQIAKYKSIVNEYLSKDEIRKLMEKSDLKGLWHVSKVWFWIIASFALVALWTNIFTIIVALFVIGGQQLACAIIMHDTSHYSLFKTRKWNDTLGNILGAWPIVHNVQQYRPYHLQHHVATGTDDDPDIPITQGYPTTKVSMARKFFRDLAGASGIKGYVGIFSMHLGFLRYSVGGKIIKIVKEERGYLWKNAWTNLQGPIIMNLLLFGICWLLGKPLLYLLWPGALLTTNQFCLRVRAMAEHSVVDDRTDPYRNTRTTYANFFERMLFAPLNVNYHLEHHFLIAAPSYNYPEMHKILKSRGFYKKGLLAKGYRQIVKMAIIN